jgi:O-antigen ligase
MTKQVLHTKAHFYLTLIIAFTLPLARLTPLFIILLLLNWVIEGDFSSKLKIIKKNKYARLFIGIYFLHILGLFYTQNIGAGLFDLQVKLSLLVFPVIFCTRSFNEDQLKKVFYAFILGGICSSLIMLSQATYTYLKYDQIRFFYEEFSILMHPSYLSMYLNLASGWVLIRIMQGKFSVNRWLNAIPIVVVVFFSIINVLLSSKMGLFTMFLMYFGLLVYSILKHRKYITGIVGVFFVAGFLYLAAHYLPDVRRRVERSIAAITNTSPDKSETESTAVRLLVWKAANHVVSNNFISGVGTGDVKDELMKEYEKEGLTGAVEHKLNTHNAFYQIFVALGLIGFSLLVISLLMPIGSAFKSKDGIYLLFLLIMIFNFLSESMLETQAGVMFYAFFNSLLCFSNFARAKQLSDQ